MTSILSDTFAPPRIATNGRSGDSSAWPRYRSSFSIKSPAAALGKWRVIAFDRGMGAVGGAERVVHVLVGERGERGRKPRLVLLLLRVEPEVLEQHHTAAARRVDAIDRQLHPVADRIVGKCDRAAEQFRQRLHDRPQAELRILLAFRAPQVAGKDRGGARGERVLNRRNGPAQSRVVADSPVFERHVEIDPDENALSLQVEVFDGKLCHFRFRGLPAGAAGRRTDWNSPIRCRTTKAPSRNHRP